MSWERDISGEMRQTQPRPVPDLSQCHYMTEEEMRKELADSFHAAEIERIRADVFLAWGIKERFR